MSIGARAWWAFHCLPRSENGKPPQLKSFELEHRIHNGALAKLFSGQRHGATPPVLEEIARALRVSTDFLTFGKGAWPELTGPIPPREITHEGKERLVPPRLETVGPPVTSTVAVDITNDFVAAARVAVNPGAGPGITKDMIDRVVIRLSKRPDWNLPRALLAVHYIKGLTDPSDDALYNAAIVADLDAQAGGEAFPRATEKDFPPAPPPPKRRGKR